MQSHAERSRENPTLVCFLNLFAVKAWRCFSGRGANSVQIPPRKRFEVGVRKNRGAHGRAGSEPARSWRRGPPVPPCSDPRLAPLLAYPTNGEFVWCGRLGVSTYRVSQTPPPSKSTCSERWKCAARFVWFRPPGLRPVSPAPRPRRGGKAEKEKRGRGWRRVKGLMGRRFQVRSVYLWVM